MFEVNSSRKRFDANKVFVLETGKFPYVVRMSSNNGQKGFIKEDEQFLNDGNTISFGQDTATMFYQEKPYFTGDKIKILKPKDNKFNKNNAQFFIITMLKSFSSFSWGASSFDVKIIEAQKIQLPVNNNVIDYPFMENFIADLEADSVKKLEAYLKASNFKDYILTSEEEKTLNNFKNIKWSEFRIGDLFEKIFTNKLPIKADKLPKQITDEYTLPCLTVLSDAYAIQWIFNDFKLSPNQYLFAVQCINKVTDLPIYSYKNKLGGWNVVKDKYIQLPSKNNEPDYKTMETLISAVKKLVIKDVVLYVENKMK